MPSSIPGPNTSRWLEENFSYDLLECLYDNITRGDILHLIYHYNSSHPLRQIFLNPTQEDFELGKLWGMKSIMEKDLKDGDTESIERVVIAVAKSSETPLTPTSHSPSKFASSSGDKAPEWLGTKGFEDLTTQWLGNYGTDNPRHPPIFTEDEERRDRELATLKGTAIKNSKNRILDLLSEYLDDLQQGKIKINEDVGLVVEAAMEQAKGKSPKIDEEPVDFTSMLEFQNSFLNDFETREQDIMYSWWCYSEQCMATDTDVDRDVVTAIQGIMASTPECTPGNSPEKVQATDGDKLRSVEGEH